MRFRIDLHLSLGKDDPEPEHEPAPTGDAIGYLADSGYADTGLGFYIPDNYSRSTDDKGNS